MTTTIEKARDQKRIQSLGTKINDQAGQIQNVRNDLSRDIRDLIKSANRGDVRMMLREISEVTAEIRSRVIHLNGVVSDLESLRNKISKLVPAEMKN